MNNLLRKITIGSLILGLAVTALPALATTATDLQAQIDALLAQIATLQTQLTALQGQAPAGSYDVPAGFTFTKNLSSGMSDPDVVNLKKVLDVEASDHAAWTGTQLFGSKVKAAVVKFQQKYSADISATAGYTIKASGFVGSGTRAKLNALLTGELPVGCNCTSWVNGTCGTGDNAGKRQQTRTCTPSACAAESQYVTDATCVTAIGAGLTVALSADTPAAATIVADSTTGQGAQSLIPAAKLKFTNGDASAVKVTNLVFKRSGISADSDVSQAYLFDGDTLLAEYNSFTTTLLTFSNSAGLFTVEAGKSKEVTLKFDLTNNDTASGKTIKFSLESATAVTSNASAVNGTFPVVGNIMSTAAASDVGRLTVATTSGPGASVDPQTGLEVYNFSLAGADQKLEVRKLKFANIGSTDADDLTNFQLYDGGVKVAEVANAASDKTITFDLTASPLVIEKGITKQMHLKADVVGGTNRTFQFTIQNMTDIVAYDTQYGIFIKPNGANSWTQLTYLPASTISVGRLTMTRASASPSGNVAVNSTNVVIAKFDIKATGEDVKIASLNVGLAGTIVADGLYQGKIYLDGSQKGSTVNLASASAGANTAFTFGNTFIIPADGATHNLQIMADIKTSGGSTASTSVNFTASINTVSATGRTSNQTVSAGTVSGYQLTISSGALATTKNGAVADWISTNPAGVPGQTEALVGSFVVTAGAAEGVDITAVQISDRSAASNLQNIKVYKGTIASGTQIGATQGAVATGTTYSFYPSPYVSLSASEQAVLSVYADIKTGSATGSVSDTVRLVQVQGVGKTTNTSANSNSDVNGQVVYIADAATLSVSLAADTPKAAQIIGGATSTEFVRLKVTAGLAEAISVTNVQVTGVLGGSAPTSTLANIKLYDGITPIGSTISGLSAVGLATFDLTASPWTIPAGGTKYLSVKADVGSVGVNATSAGTVALRFGVTTGLTYKGAVSGQSAGNTSTSTGNTMTTYKTKITVAAASNTPTGNQGSPKVNQDILYFTVANNGSYSAYFNNATVTISWTPITATSSAGGRNFFLYDSADLTTKLATSSHPGTTTYDAALLTFNIGTGTSGKEIAAGATKTFYIRGDTTDAVVTAGSTAGSRISLYITDGTRFIWNDGVSTSIASAVTIPAGLYSGVINY